MTILNSTTTDAAGRTLATPINNPGCKFHAGRMLTVSDIAALQVSGMAQVPTIALEAGEIPQPEAAQQLLPHVFAGPIATASTPSHRVDATAAEPGCLLVDEAQLRAVNSSGVAAIATLAHLSHIPAGARLAALQTPPFAVDGAAVQALAERLAAQGVPVIHLAPFIARPRVAVIYAGPRGGAHTRAQFEPTILKRLARLGQRPPAAYEVRDLNIVPALRTAAHTGRYELVIIAHAIAPQWQGGALDTQVSEALGAPPVWRLAPVEPCKTLMLASVGATQIVAVPGAYRIGTLTLLDLILPPLLAGIAPTAADIARLGEGGLLSP